jgi:uncharacterized protein YndB with AHSA1/START domain
MTTPRVIRQSVLIDAPVTTVWPVLTDSEFTKQYMYGCEIVSTWAIGGAFNWKGAADGIVYVSGTLVDMQSNRLLRYTVFDPNAGYEDTPANHLTVTCTLTATGLQTTLDIETGDFATVVNGDARYQDTVSGGDTLLLQIKAVAERFGAGSSRMPQDQRR